VDIVNGFCTVGAGNLVMYPGFLRPLELMVFVLHPFCFVLNGRNLSLVSSLYLEFFCFSRKNSLKTGHISDQQVILVIRMKFM
jgi:hypothetical protein